MAKSPLSKRPKMPMELPGEDRGGDPSPRLGMRERETSRGENAGVNSCNAVTCSRVASYFLTFSTYMFTPYS